MTEQTSSHADENPDLENDEETEQTESADDGGTPSEGGSGFASVETSEGGADAAPGTPDGVPKGNREANDLPEEGLRS